MKNVFLKTTSLIGSLNLLGVKNSTPLVLMISLLASGIGLAEKPKNEEPARPTIELGAPFADHAILQRGMELPVWGWSKPGTEVSVEFGGQRASATAGADGKWMLKLPPMQASAEPRSMLIQEKGGNTRELKDLLVGEVWVASGQSNMQWAVANSTSNSLVAELERSLQASGSEVAPIREFKITDYFAVLHRIEHATGEWDNGNYRAHSAIAFAFAYKLYRELGVPIGILNCSFSQTQIEAWTPRSGYEGSTSDYNRKIEQQLLETDPGTAEHQKAWSGYYAKIGEVVARNQQAAKDEEPRFTKLPTSERPGNMNSNRDATWLFNARINPVIPYAIQGAIWNQGYANMDRGLTYYDNLHAMIRGWRALWGRPELPVYFHQFYTVGKRGDFDLPTISPVAEMRLGTWLARDIPNAGMASQIDIEGAVHYRHKAVPGERLALHALKNQYAKPIVAEGPMYKSYKVEGNKVVVEFDHAEGGLRVAETGTNAMNKEYYRADPKVIENGADQVNLFSVAGKDRIWHPAKLVIQGDKAIVSSDAVKEPVGVAYGSGGIGWKPNLYNQALLPTTPFVVYDGKLVTSRDWPEEKLQIAGEKIDPSTIGLLNEYRKFPILGPQFRDNAVLQAGVPITIWGAAVPEYVPPAEGEKIIHFSFNGVEKTIPVTDGMSIWSVTVPAMKASATPMTLRARLTIDGELAHERVARNVVVGDVWYVAGLGDEPLSEQVSGPVRIMTRMSKGSMSRDPRPFSVCTSTTPGNRYASFWGAPKGAGFAARLGQAIHEKTGHPVGIIFMAGDQFQLKQWMNLAGLEQAPSLVDDYQQIAAVTPGNRFYQANSERYIAAWKSYWGDYIPEIIKTKSVPDKASWGTFPSFGDKVETKATMAYNSMLHPFKRTRLKGIVFMTEKSMVEGDKGRHFGPELSALANGWKQQVFGGEQDPHFYYTLPTANLAPEITRPASIPGRNQPYPVDQWHETNNKGNAINDAETLPGLIDAIVDTAY